jgi:hypothetical protein
MTAAADASVAVFHTNILIGFLNWVEPAGAELARFDKAVATTVPAPPTPCRSCRWDTVWSSFQ